MLEASQFKPKNSLLSLFFLFNSWLFAIVTLYSFFQHSFPTLPCLAFPSLSPFPFPLFFLLSFSLLLPRSLAPIYKTSSLSFLQLTLSSVQNVCVCVCVSSLYESSLTNTIMKTAKHNTNLHLAVCRSLSKPPTPLQTVVLLSFSSSFCSRKRLEKKIEKASRRLWLVVGKSWSTKI